jgi:DNA repair protein RecO (recombination protein O)
MIRSHAYTALTLRVRPSGENREAVFLTAEDGLVRATLFGGPKSKLRSYVAPFNSGTLWIYRDPVKDTRKVSDFDVRSWRPGLRELYERSDTASALSAAVLKGQGGGGEWREALAMAEKSLDALETADEETCERILIHFLWNWGNHLGLRPDPEHCASCNRTINDAEVLWFIRGEGLLCKSCAQRRGEDTPGEGGAFVLGPGARRWLSAVEAVEPTALNRISLDQASAREAKILAAGILEEAVTG